MKKIARFFLLVILLAMSSKLALAGYQPGINAATAISSSATANSWYQLNGSAQPEYDIWGNTVWAKGIMVTVDSGDPIDMRWSYYNNPPAGGTYNTWGKWHFSDGPFFLPIIIPYSGIYVCTTPTTAGNMTTGDGVETVRMSTWR